MAKIDFELPAKAETQLIAAVIFAESGTAAFGGANEDEKYCIGLAVRNMAHYAKYTGGARKCYNQHFGDGTVLSAIKSTIQAYKTKMWLMIMSADALKDKAALEAALSDAYVAHLRGAVEAAEKAAKVPLLPAKGPVGVKSRPPLQFNKAANSPPSPRMELLGKLGSHSFYGFKAGRECQ